MTRSRPHGFLRVSFSSYSSSVNPAFAVRSRSLVSNNVRASSFGSENSGNFSSHQISFRFDAGILGLPNHFPAIVKQTFRINRIVGCHVHSRRMRFPNC